MAGKITEAAENLRELLGSYPDHPDLLAHLGTLRLQQGNAQEGVRLLGKAVQAAPGHAMAWGNYALGLTMAGRFQEALAASDRLLALQPRFAQAYLLKADALKALNRREEALAAYNRALELQPSFVQALNNRGNLFLELGRTEDAFSDYGRAIVSQPGYADAHFNRANALQKLGRLAEALEGYDRVLALQPSFVQAHNNRGFVLRQLKRPGEALAAFDRVVALQPGFAEAHNNRGTALQELRRLPEALAAYDRAIALKPAYAEAHNNRGSLLKECGRPDEALTALGQALALNPGYAEAHNNRGTALLRLQKLPEALEAFDRAIDLKPGYAEAHNNRGNALMQTLRLPEALEAFDRAIALDPAYARARVNKALLKLLKGEFPEGWKLFESRWMDTLRGEASRFTQSAWTGGPLEGQTLLIQTEQGYGDMIQFCRYALPAQKAGATVILEAPRSLVSLLSTLPGIGQVVERGKPLPPFTLRCPVMSLPLALGTTLETIPVEVPYLFADEDQKASWRQKLGPRTRPRIGLVWSGNPDNKDDHNRSLPLQAMAPLLGLPFEFHSLQTEHREEDRAALSNLHQLKDHQGELKNFADTAALMDELDLILAVDTAAAHLAGALGKPVWILLPYRPDFRWLLGRSDSPWYPTAELFRQPSPGNWENVVAQAAKGLREKFNA